MRRKVIKIGENSLGVSIPKAYAEMLYLHQGDPVDVRFEDGCIVINQVGIDWRGERKKG